MVVFGCDLTHHGSAPRNLKEARNMIKRLLTVMVVLCGLALAQTNGQPTSVVVTDANGNALTITGSTILTDAQRRAAGILLQHPTSVVLTDINGNVLQLGTPSSAGTYNGVYATASTYGLNNDTQFILDATITSGSNAISCANSDCNFVAADNGKICFATNLGAAIPNWQSVVVLPQGTLTVTGAQTATCSGGNATGNATGVFVWGHDDSAALANAFTAAFNSCSNLILPGVNSQGTGPAVMLVQQAEFGVTGAGSGFNDCRETPLDTPRGIGVIGQGMTSTWVIPTPNFSATTCTFGATNACFFGTPDGQSVQNLTIWGAGNSNPGAAFASVKGASVSCSNWCQVRNVALVGWGSNATNGVTNGLVAKGGLYETLDHVLVDGFGGGEASAEVFASNVTILACNFLNAGRGQIMEVASAIAGPVISFGSQYVNPAGAFNVILMDNGTAFNSYGDVFGPTGTATVAISVGAGTINMSDGYVFSTIASAKAFTLTSGGILRLHNTTANMSGTTTTGITNAGSYFDQGGNTITATTPYTGAGNLFGSQSITGTLQTSGNIAFTSGWGTTTAGTISGNSLNEQFTLTTSVSGSSGPVLTITFPTAFLVAPRCTITQVGGTFGTLSNASHSVSTTADTITFAGTPTASQTYVFVDNCTN
jgi:hypothetical protein